MNSNLVREMIWEELEKENNMIKRYCMFSPGRSTPTVYYQIVLKHTSYIQTKQGVFMYLSIYM